MHARVAWNSFVTEILPFLRCRASVVVMDTNSVADPAAAHSHCVLQLAFPCLDLADIWCLSLTSKAAKEFCLDRLADGHYQHARDLLFSAVASEACMPAQANAGRQQLTLQAAVEWLLDANVIPPECLALDSTRYLCINNASFRKNLLHAGLRITYEAVVTAARKLTKGLHKWIEDSEACDIELQINHATRAACCSDAIYEVYSNFLSTPDVILDHIFIALNCIGSHDLAVGGNACSNIYDLCSLPAARNITAEAVEPLLHAAVQVFGNCSTIDPCEDYAVDALCGKSGSRLYAIYKLSHAALCGLLTAAAETLPHNKMLPLFQLSKVSKLAPAQKVEVILALYRGLLAPDNTRDTFAMFTNVIEELALGMPEASRVSLFKALFAFNSEDTTKHASLVAGHVMDASGMMDFSTAVLVELLRYVPERGAKDPRLPETVVAFYVKELCECPTAVELSMEDAAQLVQLARTLSYSSETVDQLSQLQVAQQQSSQSLNSDVSDSECVTSASD